MKDNKEAGEMAGSRIMLKKIAWALQGEVVGDEFKRNNLVETVLERSYWSIGSVHDFPWASGPLEK